MNGRSAPFVLLVAAPAGLAAAFLRLRWLGDLGSAVPALWIALVPALLGYSAAGWVVLRRGERLPPRSGLAVVGFALLFRLLLLDTTPSLSDDIYRYLWDGHVQAAGINPYAYAPADPALAPLRDEIWERVGHRDLVTVYPPLAQWLFRVTRAVAPGAVGLKAGLVLCDLLLIAALWKLLVLRGQDPRRVVLYAWHPLPVLEIAGQGHVDVLGVTLMVTALLWLARDRRHLAAAALAAAALSKVVPLLCLPALWRRWMRPDSSAWRRWLDPRPRWPLVWLPVAVVAAYLPYADAGPALWSGLRTFAAKWRFNDSAFGLVYAALADPRPGWEWDDQALMTARWLCLLALAPVAGWSMVRRRDPVRIAVAVLGAYLLLSPTVHPWYLLWVLPLLALVPRPAWMAFSGLVFLAYQVLDGYRAGGPYQLAAWVRWTEYAPVYLLLAWPLLRRLRDRLRRPSGTRRNEQDGGASA